MVTLRPRVTSATVMRQGDAVNPTFFGEPWVIVTSAPGEIALSKALIENFGMKSNTAKTYVMWRFLGRISIGTFPSEDVL